MSMSVFLILVDKIELNKNIRHKVPFYIHTDPNKLALFPGNYIILHLVF